MKCSGVARRRCTLVEFEGSDVITLVIVEACKSAESSGVPFCRRSLEKLLRTHGIFVNVALAVAVKTGKVENGTDVALVSGLCVKITRL